MGSVSVLSDVFCVSVVVPLVVLFIVRGCANSFPSVTAAVHTLSRRRSSLLTPHWSEPLIVFLNSVTEL